jgi:hypothetical protein
MDEAENTLKPEAKTERRPCLCAAAQDLTGANPGWRSHAYCTVRDARGRLNDLSVLQNKSSLKTVVLHRRTGRSSAKNGDFRPGQGRCLDLASPNSGMNTAGWDSVKGMCAAASYAGSLPISHPLLSPVRRIRRGSPPRTLAGV